MIFKGGHVIATDLFHSSDVKALKSISLEFTPRTKIGICGRTGRLVLAERSFIRYYPRI